jgi:acyl-CoA dehydrogenase
MAALLRHGTPEQILKWGTLINSGQAFISQLFSEPGAGSDLAGLRTRAVRQGDNWIVNGQKVWSSWAHHANYGILIARTDPSLPKHKGLSFFIIDMRQPGITVRPIRQITGHSDFNETFLVDAVVPDENRIGAEGEGWAVTMTVLGAERNAIGGSVGGGAASPTGSRNLIRLARNAVRENGSALDSAAIRAKIADWHVQEQGLKNFGARLQEQLKGGGPQPDNMPVMKLTTATMGQQIHAFMMDLDEYGGIVQDPNAPEGEDRFFSYLYSAVYRIAGGADEVLRNQISERALGMPSDMRMDKDVPFESLPI